MCAQEISQNKKLKVLAIEDDKTIIKLYEKILAAEGHKVVSAGTGGEAIRLLNEESFDLICLDLKLPDMDGAELLKIIKTKIEWTPVIIVTANPSVESSVAAVNAGIVTEYILKPFDTKELGNTIHKSVEKARLAIENKRLLKKLDAANQALTERVAQLEDLAREAVKFQAKISELTQYIQKLEAKVRFFESKK